MTDSIKNNKAEDELDIRKYIFYYLSFWRWMLLCCVLTLLVASYLYLKKEKTYECHASIFIENQDNHIQALDVLGFGNDDALIDDETVVLKSTDLLRRTVQTSLFNISYSEPTFFSRITLNKSQSPVLCSPSFSKEPKFFSLTVSNKEGTYHYQLSGADSLGRSFQQQGDFSRFPQTIQLPDASIRLSRQEENSFSKPLTITHSNSEILARRLTNTIQITPSGKKSHIVNVSSVANCPESGIDFLTELLNNYNAQANDDKSQIARNTAAFIDERIKNLSGELSEVEGNVERFKTSNNVTDISSEAQLYLTQNGKNNEELKNVENQLSIIRFVEDFVNNPQNDNQLIPNLGITDPGLSSLINSYNTHLLEKKRLENASTGHNPALAQATAQTNSMHHAIRNSISSVRKTLTITRNNLSRQNNIETSRLQRIPTIERHFLEIKRQQQIKEQLYLFLLQKREETSLTLAATSPKGKFVVQPRSTGQFVSPNKLIYALVALVAGILIPIIIIYLRDYFKSTIQSKEELERRAIPNIIGEIPFIKNMTSTFLVAEDDTSGEVEKFRSLRNTLSFITKGSDKKVIAVTSTMTNEGKTFISTNLALAFALMSKRVIVVGLDIRNPELSDVFGLPAKEGITSYLADDSIPLNSLIRKTSVSDSLDILPCGTIPPNPNELLMSAALDKVFEQLRQQYDYIIVDTAPIGIVSDTALINRVIDLTVYVTREGRTQRESVSFINSLYQSKRLNNIYIVFNGVNFASSGYYRSYHYGEYNSYYNSSARNNRSRKSFWQKIVEKIKG